MEVIVGNKNLHLKKPAIHVLIAHKSNVDASDIAAQVQRAEPEILMTRTANKHHCLELMEKWIPNVVIADYDFGPFPFINEIREKNADIPFIIISELELTQNAPKHGLNIYILKGDLARIPMWLDTLNAAGMLSHESQPPQRQIKCFQKAVESRHPEIPHSSSRTLPALISALPVQETPVHPGFKDPLKKWTEDLERKMNQNTSGLKMKPHRPNPLFPEREHPI
ncbi:MAG: hypothetical protein JWM68_785 [Verrucomicrobiales bacterium]|nr:hypothetical protein [Verrucomicrobiales bacterium]